MGRPRAELGGPFLGSQGAPAVPLFLVQVASAAAAVTILHDKLEGGVSIPILFLCIGLRLALSRIDRPFRSSRLLTFEHMEFPDTAWPELPRLLIL